MMRTMQDGPLDGREIDIPDGISNVAFPMVKEHSVKSRSLAEIEAEIRFDPDTLQITAPADLVTDYVTVRYVWDGDAFRWSP